jgi:hypothetical protein
VEVASRNHDVDIGGTRRAGGGHEGNKRDERASETQHDDDPGAVNMARLSA